VLCVRIWKQSNSATRAPCLDSSLTTEMKKKKKEAEVPNAIFLRILDLWT